MVFKKNIMLKAFILLKLFLLLGGCTYQYNNEYNVDIEDIKKIKLNVKSFEINKDSLDIITTENLLQNEINKKVLNQLEAWTLQKFAIEGIENKAFLNLLKINTIMMEKRKNKKTILSITNQGKEVYKSNCIITDTWFSMGSKKSNVSEQYFKRYQVNKKNIIGASPKVAFMHCLPAKRGKEVTKEIIDNKKISIVWDEAENRLHIQKAILEWCLKKI